MCKDLRSRGLWAFGIGTAVALLAGPSCTLATHGELASNGTRDASVSGGGAGNPQGGGGSAGTAGKGGSTGSGGSSGAAGALMSGGAGGIAGSTGAGGAGAGGLAGSGGTAGSAGKCGKSEDCTNNVDDDCNGKIDCQDPSCVKAGSGYLSLPTPPGGADYEYYHERAPNEPKAACSSTQSELKGDLNVPASSCTCTCGAVQGASCAGAGKPTVYQNKNCGGGVDPSPPAWNVCRADTPDAWTIGSVRPNGFSVATAGTCPSVVNPNIPAATHGKAVDLCSVAIPLGTGATSGESCVAVGAAPYVDAPCVLVPGNVDCSSVPGYAIARSYFAGVDDERTCTANGCTCTIATGTTCTAHVTLYSGTNCTDVIEDLAVPDGNCHGFAASHSGTVKSYEGFLSAHGGTCAPQGAGTLQGSATTTGKGTLCCSK